MDKNTISVIMACYNCEKTLPKAMDSILAQTYDNWVMICCDDGSRDRTFEILTAYASAHPHKILVLRNEENRKLPYSLNRCLQHVQTDLVARMDADDWSAPERFAIQAEYLLRHPECDLVGTGVTVTDGTKTIAHILQPSVPRPEDMLHCNCFSHATIMTHKRVYDSLGGYSLEPYVERCEDLDLWSRFFAAGFTGHNLTQELYVVLEDETAVLRRDWQNRLNTAKTLRKAFQRMGLRGFGCCKKAYFQLLTYFVPTGLYRKLHIWKIAQRTKRNQRR